MLERLARLSAFLAALVLIFIVVVTCGSIIGRETVGRTLTGDFELVGLATGAVVGLFMPLAQLRRSNIVVDFFTARAPARVNAVLDRFGALLLALAFALLAWRAALGGLSSYRANSSSMLLGVPEWWAYAPMVPGFALTAVIGFAQAIFGFGNALPHGGERS
jgi:TRAP-type C4-dicarboxylate transport system permease small subunit